MKLASIHQQIPDSLVAVLKLFGCDRILSESGPSWPEELSNNILRDPKFLQWLEELGVTGKIGNPMAGGVGRAYPMGNYIIKFTTDRKEAEAAAVMKGHTSEHAADILDVTSIPQDNLFIIVMERLNAETGAKMRIVANTIYDYLDKNNIFIDDPDEFAEKIYAHLISSEHGYGSPPLSVRKKLQTPFGRKIVQNIVNALYDVQQKTGVLSQDPHGGNIAFKGDKPAFFDFGRSKIDWDNPATRGARIGRL